MQQSHDPIGWKDTQGLPTTSRARAIEMFAMVEVDWTVELFWKVDRAVEEFGIEMEDSFWDMNSLRLHAQGAAAVASN